MPIVLKPNFEKRNGLVTVVVQHAVSLEVLMVAYTDEAVWLKMLETGLVSLYSTSRKKSWVKGEESGNFMKVVDILLDCDGDALVVRVEPQGNERACHTLARSCFYRSLVKGDLEKPPHAGDSEELPSEEIQALHATLTPR